MLIVYVNRDNLSRENASFYLCEAVLYMETNYNPWWLRMWNQPQQNINHNVVSSLWIRGWAGYINCHPYYPNFRNLGYGEWSRFNKPPLNIKIPNNHFRSFKTGWKKCAFPKSCIFNSCIEGFVFCEENLHTCFKTPNCDTNDDTKTFLTMIVVYLFQRQSITRLVYGISKQVIYCYASLEVLIQSNEPHYIMIRHFSNAWDSTM